MGDTREEQQHDNGIFGLGTVISTILDPIGGRLRWKRAREAKKREALRKADLAAALIARQERLSKIDWQPQLVSEMVGPYKKTQSPQAMAYLRSILTGNNPDAGNPWDASGDKFKRQISFEDQYGTPAELDAQQKQADADFGYTVKPPKKIDTRAITDPGADILPERMYPSKGKR